MSATLTVHFFLFIFSLVASVIQGICGFGDAIILHVVWYTACVMSPDQFNTTALGDSPVRAVTLLMYCRIIFSSPLLAYMSLHDGIFSWQLVLSMAIPSTATALAGIFIFVGATSKELKLVLGISSLVFAFLYVATFVVRYVRRRMKLAQLSGARIQESNDDALQQRGAGVVVAATRSVGASGNHRASSVAILSESAGVEADLNASRNSSFGPGMGVRPPVMANPQREGGPLQEGATEPATGAEESGASPVWVSLSSGSPFRRREAANRSITESNPFSEVEVPPLTPSKLSPTQTMTYTHVRINRNLDENGHIRLSTKIGAAVASALSGIMGSLTGVGGPPQIIFVLLFDVPSYIMRVNFAMQSVPSSALRFFYACFNGLFTTAMIPLFITTLIAGYIGLYIGVKLGKVLRPNSYSIFVLALLLLSSLVMITTSVTVLISFLTLCTIVTVGAAVYEHRKTAAAVQHQLEMERELEERRAVESVADSATISNKFGSAFMTGKGEEEEKKRGEAVMGTKAMAHTPATNGAKSELRSVPPPAATANRSSTASGQLSRNSSAGTLGEEQGSISTGAYGSSRTSSRMRKADLKRPPPLWKDVEMPPATTAAGRTACTASAGGSGYTSRIMSANTSCTSAPGNPVRGGGGGAATVVVQVPTAAAVAAATQQQQQASSSTTGPVKGASRVSSAGPQGLCAEEVKRWVAAQEEELEHAGDSSSK